MREETAHYVFPFSTESKQKMKLRGLLARDFRGGILNGHIFPEIPHIGESFGVKRKKTIPLIEGL